MEIGNQIRTLRQRRGITQEAMAQHFGITPQAVSKWERGVATPDIGMLPDLSAYFGVTIDELFSLSDDTRMERIQNMIWDVRYIPQADIDSARSFLLAKAEREPTNGRPYELLADLENHIAEEHHSRAAEYAMNALNRDPRLRNAHGELVRGMNGEIGDWNGSNNYKIIDFYIEYLEKHPDCKNAYLTIMDQLLGDYRISQAKAYWEKYAAMDKTYRVSLYKGKILWAAGQREEAFATWKEMESEFPEEWCVYHNIADYLFRSGRVDGAEKYYRKALNIQKAPRYTDPIEALAQYYEMKGDYISAIRAWEEELEIFEKEWNFSTGETADTVRREIARLEKKLK